MKVQALPTVEEMLRKAPEKLSKRNSGIRLFPLIMQKHSIVQTIEIAESSEEV